LIDFSQLSDTQLLQFVDEHFELFASERDEAFPDNVLSELEREIFAIVRRAEGFAIAYKGRRYLLSPGGTPADLMFLYVRPESAENGIGKALVETIKQSVTPGVPVNLKCEGARRKDFFCRLGFHVIGYSEEGDLYEMQWNAATSNAA
jgi:GNAT superfamily N-acetyltransferase